MHSTHTLNVELGVPWAEVVAAFVLDGPVPALKRESRTPGAMLGVVAFSSAGSKRSMGGHKRKAVRRYRLGTERKSIARRQMRSGGRSYAFGGGVLNDEQGRRGHDAGWPIL